MGALCAKPDGVKPQIKAQPIKNSSKKPESSKQTISTEQRGSQEIT